MKEIRIFLASSYELEPDRARIGNLIRELNDGYEKDDIHLRLVKWEDLDAFYNLQGKQSEYDDRIRECELFIGLFWHVAGRYTVHEVEVARGSLPAERILIFRKTAKFKPDHEGSEDEKRFLELHPDAEDDVRELDAFLNGETYETYADFGVLRKILTAKLKSYCDTVEVTEEDRKNTYSSQALQIHVVASPEAEPDLARLGDLVRHLDENSKHCCRIKLIRDIPGSDMFVSLCHTSAPKPIPAEIDAAIDCKSDDGKPRLYFCLKHVPDSTKEQSLKDLEERLQDIFEHYPDRYTQAAELKLHFLMQLERLKNSSGSVALTVEGGAICQQLGEDKFPLVSCEDMVPLQEDPNYRSLKKKWKWLLDEIEKLDRDIEKLTQQNLPSDKPRAKKSRLEQVRKKIEQQINNKQNGYLLLARTIEEQVGREQDEEIAELRDLISRGMIDLALELLPDSRTLCRERKERNERHKQENRRAYDRCELTITCRAADDLRRNRDEISALFELQIDIAENDLRDKRKEARSCHAYGVCLYLLEDYDRALEYLERALNIFQSVEDDPDTAECLDDIGDVWRGKGRLADETPRLTRSEKDRSDAEDRRDDDHSRGEEQFKSADHRDDGNACRDNGEYDAEHVEGKARLCNQKALEYYERALDIRKKLGECLAVADSYAKISSTQFALGNWKQAKKTLKSADRIYRKSEKNPDIAVDCGDAPRARFGYGPAKSRRLEALYDVKSCCKRGTTYYENGDYDRALECFEYALALRKKAAARLEKAAGEDHPDATDCHIAIVKVLLAKGDFDQALKVFQKVRHENLPDVSNCSNLIADKLAAVHDHRAEQYRVKDSETWQSGIGEEQSDIPDNAPRTRMDGKKRRLPEKTVLDDAKNKALDNAKNAPAEFTAEGKTDDKVDARKNAPAECAADGNGDNAPDETADEIWNDEVPYTADDKVDARKNAPAECAADDNGDNAPDETPDEIRNDSVLYPADDNKK